MGIEFLSKTAKPFRRSCQKGFDDLKRAHLFGPEMAPMKRSILARLADGVTLDEGQEVVLRADGDRIAVYRNEREVGACADPPSLVLERIRETGQGVAVGKLDTFHSLSRSADVVVL